MIEELKNHINSIGEELVACPMNCDGILADHQSGVLPRCLVLEITNRSAEAIGCVIIGINPGNSKQDERNHYINNGATYDNIKSYWDGKIKGLQYYTRLRRLADQLRLPGPILWTELVKCENAVSGRLPGLQVFRCCSNRYLKRELDVVPKSWPIFAVGTETYKACSYMFGDRTVIGIPHPTGSFGQFARLFLNQILRPEIEAQISEALSASNRVLWVSPR